MQPPPVFHALGLMSGTSLDGTDLAYCCFEETATGWSYKLLAAACVDWSRAWKTELSQAHTLPAEALAALDVRLGTEFGRLAAEFIAAQQLPQPDFVASHGQTVFHQPELGFTTQIGSGAALAAASKLPVICDFRTADVALGGQGAPLVPIGDQLLFGSYTACLNLGGFGNISYEQDGERLAFDTGPANIVLNPIAQQLGHSYDKGGALAASGNVLPELLEKLNALPYYAQLPPKSLGREWIEAAVNPLLPASAAPVDLLRTLVEHIALQIGRVAPQHGNMLVTGGGARNTFLIERLQAHCACAVHVPDGQLVDYKEAIVFGLLGVLRQLGRANTLASVTGATANACGGAVFLPAP